MNAKQELVNKLQKDILLWQGLKPQGTGTVEAIGLGEIEKAFPNGVFPKKAIHEFITVLPEHLAASNGFIGGVLSILMKEGAACVWVSTSRKLFPASLRLFNVDPERIIFIDVTREKDVLWVMEEALKCDGLAAVVAELNDLSLIESRRLQLAVEESGVTGFVLRKDARKSIANVATARWKITPVPSITEEEMPGVGYPRWKVELIKVRNGNPGNWLLEWGGNRFVEIAGVQHEIAWHYKQERQIG
ncbi:Error-prone repair protein ImuA [Pedobacter sp. HMWF019]|uniref:ImuA family protein n=1 Tax=Pedobacter sp. HMWF019 TaxID=2056856 RepID=UPI000D37CB08|nr:Error-prone repair protein ImuA [Pedobacter sp. HMWF019]PTT02478.1 Error-prone repair protein ImuA [Pedobacter sp. HMWF019]